ncbi:hypothetical protein ACIA8H_18855 [Streptomyces goshikiensis]
MDASSGARDQAHAKAGKGVALQIHWADEAEDRKAEIYGLLG